MKICLLVLALSLWIAGACAADAGLTSAQLRRAGFTEHIGAKIPENLSFLTSEGAPVELSSVMAGEPTFLTFVDYQCRTLCGVVAEQIANALSHMSLVPNRDYRLVLVGLGEDRGPAAAATFKRDHFRGTKFEKAAFALVGVAGTSLVLEKAVGLTAIYDKARDQYAHPIGVVLVDKSGKIRRYLDPFSLGSFNLRLALTDAGSAGTGFVDHALLLCYGWDAVTGLYTPVIRRILVAGCAAIVLLIAIGVGGGLLRERLRARPHADA